MSIRGLPFTVYLLDKLFVCVSEGWQNKGVKSREWEYTFWYYCFADDHSRVKLQLLHGDPHSDYINACFINVSSTDWSLFVYVLCWKFIIGKDLSEIVVLKLRLCWHQHNSGQVFSLHLSFFYLPCCYRHLALKSRVDLTRILCQYSMYVV